MGRFIVVPNSSRRGSVAIFEVSIWPMAIPEISAKIMAILEVSPNLNAGGCRKRFLSSIPLQLLPILVFVSDFDDDRREWVSCTRFKCRRGGDNVSWDKGQVA
jgi:hypothetical protein